MIAPHRDHNAKGEFVCKDGYKLIGSTYTYCYFGKWITKTTPICQEGTLVDIVHLTKNSKKLALIFVQFF